MPRCPKPIPPKPNAVLLKAGRGNGQPDLWRVNTENAPVVWKTFRERPFRSTLGRFLVAREAKNLRRLEGLDGVPRVLASPPGEPFTLVMTALDADPIPEEKGALSPEFFRDLAALLHRIHDRGLNHGDLRRKNVLAGRSDGTPQLVDFAQSLCLPVGFGRDYARRLDWLRFVKLKRWYLGDDALEPHEDALFRDGVRGQETGHWMRKRLYRPYKHWRRGKTRRRSRAAESQT